MDTKPLNIEADLLDGSPTALPGQTVLPGMQQEVGYESAVLEDWLEKFCWRRAIISTEPAYKSYLAVKRRVKEATARVESSKLLTLPNIVDRIEAIKSENRDRYRLSADDVMLYYGKIAKIDRRRFLDPASNGKNVLRLADLDDELASICDFEVVTIKQQDGDSVTFDTEVMPVVPLRAKGYEGMARILGLDKSKIELTGKDGGPVAIDVTQMSPIQKAARISHLLKVAQQRAKEKTSEQ